MFTAYSNFVLNDFYFQYKSLNLASNGNNNFPASQKLIRIIGFKKPKSSLKAQNNVMTVTYLKKKH
jgi:hypothetical protein